MPEPALAAGPVDVRLVGPEAWSLWREGRLRALLDTPTAFGSTYEREVAFSEAWAAERGLPVELGVTVGNDAARKVYERTGFVATGETSPLRPGVLERLERMVLRAAQGRDQTRDS